jgi:hypothetical protein
MARAIRQIGLTLLGALNRLLNGRPTAGWRRSTRRAEDLASK